MKIKTVISVWIFATFVAILVLCRPMPVFAVSTVTIAPAGDGIFAIQGAGIEGASAFEINVSYDPATLSNPRLVEGPLIAGAMTATNTTAPGTVRIVIIRVAPITGSGVIATLTFDRTGPSPGRINALKARLANATGAPLLAQVEITNPPDVLVDSSAAAQSQNAPAGPDAAQAGAVPLGTSSPVPSTIGMVGPAIPAQDKSDSSTLSPAGHDVQPPAQDSARAEENDRVAAAQTASIPISDQGNGPASHPRQARNIYTQKSVLERFQEYKGERTADAFASLFNQEYIIGCRQDPPVALSDGKTAVLVTFISLPGNLTLSDVAVTGAKLISLSSDPDNTNTWNVKLIPQEGGYQASIAVLQGKLKMIYPLTIAPKINVRFSQAGKPTKADFNRYLARRATAKPSGPDLNSDGKWDYRDDYILTANYLFTIEKAEQIKSKAPAAEARL